MLLAVVITCSCSLILADEEDIKINDIFKDFKKAEDAFANVVRGVDADALDDFDDRIKDAGKRGGVESVERWNQQKKRYIRTRAMNQNEKNSRYTRMVLLAAGAVPKIRKAFNTLEASHKAALKKASDANEVDVLITLNAEWRKLLPFIDPDVKDGLQALRYYCLDTNEPVGQHPATSVEWTIANGGNGHWYQFVSTRLTWDAARADSVRRGGYLATVTSEAEANFLISLPLENDPWLGGYQDIRDRSYTEPVGGWKWISGEPWSYYGWAPNEPDNGRIWGAGREQYMGLSLDPPKTLGMFFDTMGTNQKTYIIEYDN